MVVKQVFSGQQRQHHLNMGRTSVSSPYHLDRRKQSKALEISDSALAAWRGADSVLELGHDSKANSESVGTVF